MPNPPTRRDFRPAQLLRRGVQRRRGPCDAVAGRDQVRGKWEMETLGRCNRRDVANGTKSCHGAPVAPFRGITRENASRDSATGEKWVRWRGLLRIQPSEHALPVRSIRWSAFVLTRSNNFPSCGKFSVPLPLILDGRHCPDQLKIQGERDR